MRNKIAISGIVAAIAFVFAVIMCFNSAPAFAEGENVFGDTDTIGATYVTHANAATDWSVAESSQLNFANTGFTPDEGAELASAPYTVTLNRYPASGSTEWTRVNNVSVNLPPISSYPHAGIYQWQITETPLNLDSTKWSQSTPVYRMTAFIGNANVGLVYVNWYIEQMTDDAGAALATPEKIDAAYDPASRSEMDFALDYTKNQTLSVSKEVEGAFGDKSYAFPIQTTLYLPDWYAEQGGTVPPVMYSDNTQAGVPAWDNAASTWVLVVTNNLADSQSKVFNVPVGTRYSVTETNTSANGAVYTPSVSWTTETGTNKITYVSNIADRIGTASVSTDFSGNAIAAKNPFGSYKGYGVTSWNTDPDGVSGTSYEPGDAIESISSDMTLYASGWDERTYTIQFIAPGAKEVPESITGLRYNDVITDATDPVYIGYEFTGWYTNDRRNDESDRVINGTTTVAQANPNDDKEDGIIILYGSMTLSSYTVSYDLQGGTGTASYYKTKSNQRASSRPMPTRNPTKAGYVFGGWYTEPDGQGNVIQSRTTMLSDVVNCRSDNPVKEFTFYAYWRQAQISYDANAEDAIGTVAPTQKDENTGNAIVTSGVYTRPGYVLSGWNTQADGLGTSYAAGDSVAISADTTLYAQWTSARTVLVHYDSGGAPSECVPADRYLAYSTGIPAAVEFKWPGYENNGFYADQFYFSPVDSTMTVADVLAAAAVEDPSIDPATATEVTVYAYFLPKDYMIYYYDYDGRLVDNMVVSYDSLIDYTMPQRAGYTFDGWYTEVNGGGTKVTSSTQYGDIVANDSVMEKSVYAHWIAD